MAIKQVGTAASSPNDTPTKAVVDLKVPGVVLAIGSPVPAGLAANSLIVRPKA